MGETEKSTKVGNHTATSSAQFCAILEFLTGLTCISNTTSPLSGFFCRILYMPFMRKAGLFFIPKCPTCDRGKSGLGRINSSGSSCGSCAGSSNGVGGSKSKVGNIVCFARDHPAWAGYEIRHGGLTIGEAKLKACRSFLGRLIFRN
jgi:hypothetical protein